MAWIEETPHRGSHPRTASAGYAALLAALVLVLLPGSPSDWPYMEAGARTLLSTQWVDVYRLHPDIQVGPLALLVSAAILQLGALAPKVAAVACVLPFPYAIRVLRPRGADRRMPATIYAVLVAALALLPWAEVGVRGHIDDAIALFLLTGSAWAARRNRLWVCGGLVAASIAAKPWAIIGLAIILALPDPRARVRAFMLAVLGTSAVWAPFAIAGLTRSASIQHDVSDGSALTLIGLGTGNALPTWFRFAQLALSLAAALAAYHRGGIGGSLLAGVAVRLLLEPAVITYHYGLLVAVAAVVEMEHRRPPVRIMVATSLWFLALLQPDPRWSVYPRTLALAALASSCCLRRHGRDLHRRHQPQRAATC